MVCRRFVTDALPKPMQTYVTDRAEIDPGSPIPEYNA